MTTWMERFRTALRLMCGAEPPEDVCQEWLDDVQVDFADRLQEWVVNQPGTPEWAQGIATIEAAMTWADNPTEGDGHQYREDLTPNT